MPISFRNLLPLSCLLLLPASCRKDDPPPPPPETVASTQPVDRLTPGELAEGKVEAFGLKLPRGMKLRLRTPTRVEAETTASAERVANYVRKRTKAQSVELGAARTVFEQVKVLDDQFDRRLRIEVVSLNNRTRLILHDLSPPKIDPFATPEERWKKHGFDEEGRLLNPHAE